MSVLDQVRNLERHAADIADLRGQHQKPMCGFRDIASQWAQQSLTSACVPNASEPYIKF